MSQNEFEQKYVAPVIAAGCAYETVAIVSGIERVPFRLPTISALVRELYNYKAGKVAFWLVSGWATAHFLSQEGIV